jgi:hypothetical protein
MKKNKTVAMSLENLVLMFTGVSSQTAVGGTNKETNKVVESEALLQQ